MIRVVCGCGRVFKAEDHHAGKRTRCPACGTNLVIGQTSTTGSGETDLAEVPSWWYPSDPGGKIGKEVSSPVGHDDPEAYPTTVLESGFVVEGAERVGLREGGRQPPPVSVGQGGTSRNLVGVLAVAVALTLGTLCWTWWTSRLPGGAAGGIPPGTDEVARDAGRIPGSMPLPVRDGPPPFGDGAVAVPDPIADAGRSARPPRRLGMLVPAYIYPAGDGHLQWRRLFDAAAKVDLVAIVNPDSGPGAERNPDYAALITEAAERGVKLVGYINTQYAARPASEVKADVDTWLRFYPRIAGFFLDQQPADARHSAYLVDIGEHARGKLRNALVIGDPGIPCDESYLARHASDMSCIFSAPEGFAAFELPANLKPFQPSRFAALVHHVDKPEAMRSALRDAIIKRIGWIYVTDGKLPNPWNRLPSYWEAEIEAVVQLH